MDKSSLAHTKWNCKYYIEFAPVSCRKIRLSSMRIWKAGYEEVTDTREQVADALKGVEKRLADMALLIKNISTYQKTKPVYDAYRAAKNKAQYRAGQGSNIILHEAAVRAIKAAGISGKLPNVAALQAEYGKLQEQKETLYSDYGKLKKQVKEHGVIKQNIDSILRQNREPERGKEAER